MSNLHKDVVKELIDWIDGHLTARIRVDDIASKAGYSKWYLQRIFRAETGMSLAQFVRRRKIRHAAALLCAGNVSIITVALNLGYENQQTFCRVFSACYGEPPSRWLQTHQIDAVDSVFWQSSRNSEY